MKNDEIMKKIVEIFLNNKDKIKSGIKGECIYINSSDFYIQINFEEYDADQFWGNASLGKGIRQGKNNILLKSIPPIAGFKVNDVLVKIWQEKTKLPRVESQIRTNKEIQNCLGSFG